MAATTTHKELTAHLRGRIKASGIKARCKLQEYCGSQVIRVSSTGCDVRFTEDEQRTIRTIGMVNGLTWVHGLPIDPEQMTNPYDFVFYL